MTVSISRYTARLGPGITKLLDSTHVAYYYSSEQPRYFGIAAVNPDDPDAYPIRRGADGRLNLISTSSALRALGHEPGTVNGWYTAEARDGIIIIDLYTPEGVTI